MIKENYIKEYLSNINFKSDDWTVDSIKDDLKKMLGEYPAIDIIYKKDVCAIWQMFQTWRVRHGDIRISMKI